MGRFRSQLAITGPIRRSRVSLLFAGAAILSTACAPRYPSTDIRALVRDKNAAWISRAGASYSVYSGYGSACAHAGLHANFTNGSTNSVFAANDGVVSEVIRCKSSGANDRYEIALVVGMVGSVAVTLHYEMEPYGGKTCSAATVSDDTYRSMIYVNEGQAVSKGDEIARVLAAGAGAHVHVHLSIDGATFCPDIFPASALSDVTLNAGGVSPAACGSTAIPARTTCINLTDGENLSRFF